VLAIIGGAVKSFKDGFPPDATGVSRLQHEHRGASRQHSDSNRCRRFQR
jgi:hypothetical protein